MRPLLPIFVLDGQNVDEDASVGDVVGTFHGSDNYVLDEDTSGQFAIDGNLLEVDNTLTAGEYEITVSADSGTLIFVITVLEV